MDCLPTLVKEQQFLVSVLAPFPSKVVTVPGNRNAPTNPCNVRAVLVEGLPLTLSSPSIVRPVLSFLSHSRLPLRWVQFLVGGLPLSPRKVGAVLGGWAADNRRGSQYPN